MSSTDWAQALKEARGYVLMWDGRVTFGMTYHYLTEAGIIPDTRGAYRYLSELTARERAAGRFPTFGVARGTPVAVTYRMAEAARTAHARAWHEPGLARWRAAIEAALEVAE